MGRQSGDGGGPVGRGSSTDLADDEADGKAIIANPLWKPKAPTDGEMVRGGSERREGVGG
jgi:hypothetical protein